MTDRIELVIDADGVVTTMYSDRLAELGLGRQKLVRASIVEWDEAEQVWVAFRLPRMERICSGANRRDVERRERELLQAEL